jgi:glycosyltransferase involved in cell wall biosynthesis
MSDRVPKLALVTPSLNQGAFLRACIDSVRAQTDVSLNYVVRDGGSHDDSVDTLRSYGSEVTWHSERDGGQVRAINAGLKEADEDICGYLNSDDVLLPHSLARVEAIFAKRPEVDVVYGRAWWVDANGQTTREYPTMPWDPEALVQHCYICQPAAFWRRRVHERFGWFDPVYDNTFDYEFWLRLMKGGAKFHYLDEYLAGSREHPATKSALARGRIFSEIRHMQLKHFGYCGRNWWEQQLRYWRDESRPSWARLLPGKKDQRMYRLAWWPYTLWRRRLGGPLIYRRGHFRC